MTHEDRQEITVEEAGTLVDEEGQRAEELWDAQRHYGWEGPWEEEQARRRARRDE